MGERWILMWWGVPGLQLEKAIQMVEFMQDEGKIREGETTLGLPRRGCSGFGRRLQFAIKYVQI